MSILYYPYSTGGGTEVLLKVAAPNELIADKHADVLTPSLVLFLLVYGASSEARDLVQVCFLDCLFFIHFGLHIHPTIVLLRAFFALWVLALTFLGREVILMLSCFSILCQVFWALDLLFHFFIRRRLLAHYLSLAWKFPLLREAMLAVTLLLHPSCFSAQLSYSWTAQE